MQRGSVACPEVADVERVGVAPDASREGEVEVAGRIRGRGVGVRRHLKKVGVLSGERLVSRGYFYRGQQIAARVERGEPEDVAACGVRVLVGTGEVVLSVE